MSGNAPQREFEGLVQSVRKIQELRKQLESAEKRHLKFVNEVLEQAKKNPSKWKYRFQMQSGKPAEVKMTGELAELLKALSVGSGFGVEVGCPDITGCANLGRSAGICHYICKTVEHG